MDRQQLLVLAGMLVAVLGFALQSYTAGNAPLVADPEDATTPRPLPEKPASLNATSAAAFAAAYEEARLHNEVLDRADGVTRIDAVCNGTPTNVTADGYRVAVHCSYAWETRHAGETEFSDGDPYTARYLITPTRTRRMTER